MEFQNVLESRRSIRQYDPQKPVTEDMVKELLSAAILAPTWKNSQTGRYYCILSPEQQARFRSECLPPFNAKNCEGAGALLVATFVKNRAGFDREGNPDNEVGNGWGFYDLGLQTENLLLKARDLGLDSLVMGIRDEAKIREFLSIPETEIIVSVISLGYAAAPAAAPKRKAPEDVVKFF